MRCKQQYRESWEEEWDVGGNESEEVGGVEICWALKVQERNLAVIRC